MIRWRLLQPHGDEREPDAVGSHDNCRLCMIRELRKHVAVRRRGRRSDHGGRSHSAAYRSAHTTSVTSWRRLRRAQRGSLSASRPWKRLSVTDIFPAASRRIKRMRNPSESRRGLGSSPLRAVLGGAPRRGRRHTRPGSWRSRKYRCEASGGRAEVRGLSLIKDALLRA